MVKEFLTEEVRFRQRSKDEKETCDKPQEEDLVKVQRP
jgi:hypothetical protein